MDNVKNCDNYINILWSKTNESHYETIFKDEKINKIN
jgi:hypothetical protein